MPSPPSAPIGPADEGSAVPGESTPNGTVTDTKASADQEDQPQAGDNVAVSPTSDSPGTPSGEEEVIPVEVDNTATGERWKIFCFLLRSVPFLHFSSGSDNINSL